MIESIAANPHLSELESLVVSIQIACKTIASVVERASITGVTGLQSGGGSINVQGEEQKKLDGNSYFYRNFHIISNYVILVLLLVITNEIMKNALRFSGKVGVLASEEEDKPLPVDGKLKDKYSEVGLRTTQFKSDVVLEETATGRFIAVFDPLDGSSNVDAGIPTGTIFGVFEQDPDEVQRNCYLYMYVQCTLVQYMYYCNVTHSIILSIHIYMCM
jgi:fructose-1,6-bisphosphatase I